METLGDCGRGGWTLVMKMSGNKRTFEYDSSKWTNKEVYNVDGGLANFSNIETLLESYWNVPFTMICLGMQYNDEKRWMKFAHNGSSLYDVIADNKQQTTTLARDKWLGLINNARLQSNCNKNGFNVGKSNVKARIGIVADDGDQCNNYNSIIGFGLDKLRSAQGSSRTIACGSAYLKNPKSKQHTFGFVFVQ
ncbi:uncharacterized skeletal organic matrix protein 5-like isoform X2 [Xenia sp. Carnegie-2017]|nr:uncharacterized skeletal organic matrix protein 5-like isoform X2 [Xenia sp. Carnegie-2017]